MRSLNRRRVTQEHPLMRVFDRAGRGWRTLWRGPAVNEDVQAAQLLRRLGDHAVHLLLPGDIGCEGNDAPVRLDSQLPRRRLQIPLVPRHDRHIDPFASQFPRNDFADAPTAASHDRMLALQTMALSPLGEVTAI